QEIINALTRHIFVDINELDLCSYFAHGRYCKLKSVRLHIILAAKETLVAINSSKTRQAFV
ncbi:hypothetical protein QTO17_04580, partial [Vibrio owensii]